MSKDEEMQQLHVLREYVEDLGNYWNVSLKDLHTRAQRQADAIQMENSIILGVVFLAGLVIGSAVAKLDG